jgi:hypothetical protein
MKAFVINVIGDIGLVLAAFLIFRELGVFDYLTVFEEAPSHFDPDSGTIVAICLLLLVGAFAKSAQLPLHTWLPDAMEGPTPVSALIHAATMVTAGVYLIARMHPLERWKKGWVPAAAGTSRSAWLGELQSLPFDESGPVEFAKGHHPVTLFDWQAWHAFASRGGKSVVLAVQDCKRCRDHVARAVIALSRPPGPRAYTHLVVSKDTAYHALELLRRGGDDGDACLVSSLSS